MLFGENTKTIFDNSPCPVVDFVVLISVASDGLLDGLFDYLADVVDDKLILKMRHVVVSGEVAKKLLSPNTQYS